MFSFLQDNWIIIISGYFGGLSGELLKLFELRYLPKKKRPPTFSDWMYWAEFVGVPILAAGLVTAYQLSNCELTAIVAVNIGASAPLILKSFVNRVPPGVSPTN